MQDSKVFGKSQLKTVFKKHASGSVVRVLPLFLRNIFSTYAADFAEKKKLPICTHITTSNSCASQVVILSVFAVPSAAIIAGASNMIRLVPRNTYLNIPVNDRMKSGDQLPDLAWHALPYLIGESTAFRATKSNGPARTEDGGVDTGTSDEEEKSDGMTAVAENDEGADDKGQSQESKDVAVAEQDKEEQSYTTALAKKDKKTKVNNKPSKKKEQAADIKQTQAENMEDDEDLEKERTTRAAAPKKVNTSSRKRKAGKNEITVETDDKQQKRSKSPAAPTPALTNNKNARLNKRMRMTQDKDVSDAKSDAAGAAAAEVPNPREASSSTSSAGAAQPAADAAVDADVVMDTIECIVGKRILDGQVQYQVRWQDSDESDWVCAFICAPPPRS